jgi:hypothetical protein
MGKEAISVTLDADNITWLRGRATAGGARSLSEMLDQIVTAARSARAAIAPPRSVVGTIEIDAHDPTLDGADAAVRTLFQASIGRPTMVKELRAIYGAPKAKKGRRG